MASRLTFRVLNHAFPMALLYYNAKCLSCVKYDPTAYNLAAGNVTVMVRHISPRYLNTKTKYAVNSRFVLWMYKVKLSFRSPSASTDYDTRKQYYNIDQLYNSSAFAFVCLHRHNSELLG